MPRVFVIADEEGMISFRGNRVDPYIFADNFCSSDNCDASVLAQDNGFSIDSNLTSKVYEAAVMNRKRFSWKESMRILSLGEGKYQPSDYFGLSVVCDQSSAKTGYLFQVEDSVEIEEMVRAGIEHIVLN